MQESWEVRWDRQRLGNVTQGSIYNLLDYSRVGCPFLVNPYSMIRQYLTPQERVDKITGSFYSTIYKG